MIEEENGVDSDFVSSSIYESRLLQENTDIVKKSKVKHTGKYSQGNARPVLINGVKQEVMSNRVFNSKMPPSTTVPEPNINLSREELLKLLSVFEGELQARDEVIEILKSERPHNPAIQERYGLSSMPLQALQRDAASLDSTTQDHVAEQTKENLQKIIHHQKESYKKLKQALLGAEQANQRLAVEITDEKKKHQEYMIKSDDFVNLLEEERERLKIELKREKDISENKEAEARRKLKTNKEELAKLKSLSLVLVEERQHQVADLAEHKKLIVELERRLKEAEVKCKESESEINAEKEHAIQLENDLEIQSNKFFQSQEDTKVKLEEERQKNQELEEKVETMTCQLKKLKTVQRNLQKTDDQLWRIHEKLEKDEEHDLLLEEVELLRQRVKGMEEGEKIYTQAQEDCKHIHQKLEEEIALTRNLRVQLKTLQTQVKAQKDLQRSIEDTDFRFDELQLKFEFEKRKSNDMKEQLQKMKTRMTDLDQYENMMKESEEKMNKMKEKIILITDEKKCVDDQVKFLIEKNLQLKNDAKTEKDKVTETTEKFIRESKKVLKIRDELAQEKQKFSSQIHPIQDKLKEAEERIKELSSNKQSQAEEANDRLRRQVIMLKSRLDQLEEENETKDKLISSNKSPVQVTDERKNFDMVNLVQSMKETENRCEQLTEQLHTKAKLCEDLKKQLSLYQQTNNNCNLKGVSVTASFTQTEDSDILQKQNSAKGNQSPTQTQNKPNSLKKGQSVVKTRMTKIAMGSDSQMSSHKAAFALPKASNKPPMSPTSSLTRGGKVTPVNFRVSKTNPPNKNPQSLLERASQEKEVQHDSSVTSSASTIKITRDGDTGAPVIKTENESLKATQNNSKTTGYDKGINVANTNSKIPKQLGVTRSFRTFQVQKDFSELQKKWAAKIAK